MTIKIAAKNHKHKTAAENHKHKKIAAKNHKRTLRHNFRKKELGVEIVNQTRIRTTFLICGNKQIIKETISIHPMSSK